MTFLSFLKRLDEYGLVDAIYNMQQLNAVGFYVILNKLQESDLDESELDSLDWDSLFKACYWNRNLSLMNSSNYHLETDISKEYLMCGISSLIVWSRKLKLDIMDVVDSLTCDETFEKGSISITKI